MTSVPMRRYAVNPAVGWVEDGDRRYVAVLPDGELLILTGGAVAVWDTLVDAGTSLTSEQVRALLESQLVGVLSHQVTHVLDELVGLGVLESP